MSASSQPATPSAAATPIASPPTLDAAAPADFGAAYAAEQLRRSHHPLRRIFKGFYLRSVLQWVSGPTVDVGCGAGQLLRELPPGSLGLEVNPHLVQALQAAGLPVLPTTADEQGLDLPGLEPGRYESLVISHVLEHLPDPTASLQRLLRACDRLGIARVVVVVPGRKGYDSDATHRTFIDAAFVQRLGWQQLGPYQLQRQRHFPFPWEGAGRFYIYNEMQLMFERTAPVGPGH